MADRLPAPSSLRLTRSASELREAFYALQSRADVARLLDVRLMDVVYYGVRFYHGRYRTFSVAKRSGSGHREIWEPVPGLKIIQQKLLQVLEAVFEPPDEVHGFVAGRSMATNAFAHEGSREVLNFDLADFFPSINFGRVWGMLKAEPYRLPHDAATLVTQLVTHENMLPQGAPTSPILANMVAGPLDTRMRRLARRFRLTYSRYADDITFSGRRIPLAWVQGTPGDHPGNVTLDAPIVDVVTETGFRVNPLKTRLMRPKHRKLVTGLVVNDRVNVRRDFLRELRARLHAWERYGEKAAEAEWVDHRDRLPDKQPRFRDVVLGQLDFLSMVRGNDDRVFDRYYRQYCQLAGVSYLPVKDRAWNHLARTEDAIWVLECDETSFQGSGFFLREVGLVTCAHVLGTSTVAFPPKRPELRQPVTVLAKDDAADLAILSVGRPFNSPLEPLYSPTPRTGQLVTALGYPDYVPGSSLWRGDQTVSGTRRFGSVDRVTLSAPINKGMSGGPIIDRRNRVIGVAATDEFLHNSVVPVGQVLVLAAAAGIA